MSKQLFKDYAFRDNTMDLISEANTIIEEYQNAGLVLTLRQIYYQFVSRDLLPNTQKSYDKLGTVISKARLAGLIDWAAIEDRTRSAMGRSNWNSPLAMIKAKSDEYSIGMWKNQENYVEVWIEKDALVGVIESVCYTNDINFLACRGYVSQSELYKAGKRLKCQRDELGKNPIVIHLGDHDPSGIDMTRDNFERLCMFSGGSIELIRIALNYDQVQQYNPPPNPAKITDTRAKGYIKIHGDKSWELDALEPTVLQKLIQETIDSYKNDSAWEESELKLSRHRQTLKDITAQLKQLYS